MVEVSPDAQDPQAERAGGNVEWSAVLNGALVGMALLAAASIVIALVDQSRDDFDGSALQRMMLVVIFGAYVAAGSIGARGSTRAPLTNGALASIGALVAWIPLRMAIWAVRDNGRDLVGGDDPIFTIGAMFGHLVIASAFGMIGAFAYARWAGGRKQAAPPSPPSTGSTAA